MAILYPKSLANLVVEVGTRHNHQIPLCIIFVGCMIVMKAHEKYLISVSLDSDLIYGNIHMRKPYTHTKDGLQATYTGKQFMMFQVTLHAFSMGWLETSWT